jgi:hypothetical protein
MKSFLNRLLAGAFRTGRQLKRIRPRSSRLTLECLEGRIVPSAYHVKNLNDMGADSLRAAVIAANANPGSTIDFKAGLTGTINLNSTLSITKAMEIDGPGAGVITVSGRNLHQVFAVSGPGPVTITDMTVANGHSGSGGGLYDNGTPLTLSRVTFTNNQSSLGGAIFDLEAFLFINNCLFTGNQAVTPIGTAGEVAGGAIASAFSILTVVDTGFTNNMAIGCSNVTVSIASVTGDALGGAVACISDQGTDVFTGSTSFTDNSARGGSRDSGASGTTRIGDGMGGAIDIENCAVEVDQSTFSTNVAQGGTTFVAGSAATDCGEGYGGAIHINDGGQLVVNDSTFSRNRALGANFGSAADINNPLANENAGAGGAINAEDSTTVISLSGDTFDSNTAMGGITGYITSSGGLYGGNGKGGAIYIRDASAEISGGTFTSNAALGANGTGDAAGGTGLGGAIRCLSGDITVGEFTQFNNNRAQGGNGGLFGGFGGDAWGGGLSAESALVNLWDLTFTSNRAIGGNGQGAMAAAGFAAGGGISLRVTTTSADNLTVQSNLAQGGIGVSGAFGGNALGGGIYAIGDTAVTISDSLVTLNTAQGSLSNGGTNGGGFGGGIADFEGPAVFSLPNTTVTGNTASTLGDDFYP